MLDIPNQTMQLAEQLNSLPCLVELPEEWSEGFERHGPAQSMHDDSRQYPRFHCRGRNSRAALEYQSTIEVLKRSSDIFGVFITDVSRGGIGFLHHEQLFPGEQMSILLPNGQRRKMEIAWCRRVERRCFEIGAWFLM